MGDINPGHCSNSSIKPSSSVTLLAGSWVDESFSPAIMVSITSFTNDSDEVVFSCWLSDYYLKLYLTLILSKKHLMVSILTNISLFNLIGWDALDKRVPIGNMLLFILL